MKAFPLSAPDQAQAAIHAAAVAAAQAALVAANQVLALHLATASGNVAGSPPVPTLTAGQRLQLTSDGTSAILLP